MAKKYEIGDYRIVEVTSPYIDAHPKTWFEVEKFLGFRKKPRSSIFKKPETEELWESSRSRIGSIFEFHSIGLAKAHVESMKELDKKPLRKVVE